MVLQMSRASHVPRMTTIDVTQPKEFPQAPLLKTELKM
jgi:hypothetical protein